MIPICFSSSAIIEIRRNGGVKSTSCTCAKVQDPNASIKNLIHVQQALLALNVYIIKCHGYAKKCSCSYKEYNHVIIRNKVCWNLTAV